MPTKLEPADVAHFTQAQRRAVLGALCTAVFADGVSEPRKAGALRASLDARVWGVSGAEILGDFVEAQKESARRSAHELVALGQTCALACPTLALREKLLTMMLEIAWIDSVFQPEEQQVIDAFAHGLGVPRERLAALVAPAAPAAPANDSNIFPQSPAAASTTCGACSMPARR